jgi:hypothetical protein
MSDEQIWNLVVTVGSYAVTAIGTVVFVTWWFKSQLVGGEIAGLKAENKSLRAEVGNVTASREVLDQRRLLAEEQHKKTADDLVAVKAKLEIAMAQINQHASPQALSETIRVATFSTDAAIVANTATGTLLKSVTLNLGEVDRPDVKRVPGGPFDLTLGSGDMDWPGRDKK